MLLRTTVTRCGYWEKSTPVHRTPSYFSLVGNMQLPKSGIVLNYDINRETYPTISESCHANFRNPNLCPISCLAAPAFQTLACNSKCLLESLTYVLRHIAIGSKLIIGNLFGHIAQCHVPKPLEP
ncbi:hypothetical protein J6590_011248 [Homalodisca vitripennis]|nr:hypothetical protein J6590_011248 [Homalodisca vitripennis]